MKQYRQNTKKSLPPVQSFQKRIYPDRADNHNSFESNQDIIFHIAYMLFALLVDGIYLT